MVNGRLVRRSSEELAAESDMAITVVTSRNQKYRHIKYAFMHAETGMGGGFLPELVVVKAARASTVPAATKLNARMANIVSLGEVFC